MRHLADAMGCRPMSLYNHIHDKSDLLDGMLDTLVAHVELPTAQVRWDKGLRRCGQTLYAELIRHPWACELMMLPPRAVVPRSPRLHYIEAVLACLSGAGFPPEQVYRGYHAFDSHVLGFSMWQIGHTGPPEGAATLAARFLKELTTQHLPHMAEHVHQHQEQVADFDDEFESGLDLVIAALRSQLRRHRTG